MIKRNNEIEKQLLQKYKDIGLGCSEVCKNCRGECNSEYGVELSRPIGAWFVGSKFADKENKYRILFIGKNARGVKGKEPGVLVKMGKPDDPNDPDAGTMIQFDSARAYLSEKSSPYWSYTRAIAEQVFGKHEDPAEYIAFTNIVKCNISDTIDDTPKLLRENCVGKMGVIQKEIEIIKPNVIIMYTSYSYDKEMEILFPSVAKSKGTTVAVGKRRMPWFEANVEYGDGQTARLLRVGHPQGKMEWGETGFVTLISDWILSEQFCSSRCIIST